MSLSPGIRVSCSGKSNKAPSTYRLLRVDRGVKPSSCSVFKPRKAHISCINHLHIQLLSSLLQRQQMWITLFLTHIIYIRFAFLNTICYLDKTFIKCVTNKNTGMDLFMQGCRLVFRFSYAVLFSLRLCPYFILISKPNVVLCVFSAA